MWGIFFIGIDTHVAPIRKDGTLQKDHSIDEFCKCYPQVYFGKNGQMIVVHNSIN